MSISNTLKIFPTALFWKLTVFESYMEETRKFISDAIIPSTLFYIKDMEN